MRRLLTLCLGVAALGATLIAVNPPSLAYLLIASTAAPPSYAGPGDVTTFTSWWGLRAYTAAIAAAGTQHLVTILRASDSHSCDILVATNGGFGNTASCGTGGDNGQSASSFCNATTCTVTKVFDQVGSTPLDANGGTAFPALTFNCINTTLPCISANGGVGQELRSTATFTNNASKKISTSWVHNSNSGSGGSVVIAVTSGNNFADADFSATSVTWFGGVGGTFTSPSQSDSAFHANNLATDATTNPSTWNVDGTEASDTTISNSSNTAVILAFRNQGSGVMQQVEAGFADNTVWTLSIRSKLCDNQGTYWGTSKGTHCNSSGT